MGDVCAPWGEIDFDRKVEHTFDIKPDTLARVEVITGTGRRRRWPREVKARIVMESQGDGAMVSAVARRHGSAHNSCSPGAGRLALAALRRW
jgi:hypothetical protein